MKKRIRKVLYLSPEDAEAVRQVCLRNFGGGMGSWQAFATFCIRQQLKREGVYTTLVDHEEQLTFVFPKEE